MLICTILVLNENNESINRVFKNESQLWGAISKFQTLQDAHSWIENFLVTVNEYLLSKTTNKYNLIVEKIIEFIDENYMTGINIDTIAENLNYSPNYLSYVFKQSTKETIVDYILKLKIKKAKEMLMDIRNKIYFISESLGFSNTAYFCSVFKKATSMTPNEYRERYLS